MAYATILMTNGVEVKQVPIGFSWTTFFWGGFPALFRGDWGWGIGIMIGNVFTYALAGVICAFFYNSQYAKGLFNKGFWVHSMPPNMTEDGLKAYLGYMKLPTAKPV